MFSEDSFIGSCKVPIYHQGAVMECEMMKSTFACLLRFSTFLFFATYSTFILLHLFNDFSHSLPLQTPCCISA